jgi:hypothetical protein
VQSYDANGRLLHLRDTAADETLLAEFSYQLDGVGNRIVVTRSRDIPDFGEVVS